jgi:hypothetical protein
MMYAKNQATIDGLIDAARQLIQAAGDVVPYAADYATTSTYPARLAVTAVGEAITRMEEVIEEAFPKHEQKAGRIPVAWSYELARSMNRGTGEYSDWGQELTMFKPRVPDGSIRNLTPLYTRPEEG